MAPSRFRSPLPRRLAAGALLALLCAGCRSRPAPTRAATVLDAAAPPMVVRAAAVAGSWYPGDRAELGAYVDQLLEAATAPSPPLSGPVRALIAPHAGYRFSGAVAGHAYRAVRGEAPRRVILLGPAHRGFFRGASILAVTHYRTPLGDIPVDREAAARLAGEPLVAPHPEADEGEHSLEMQLPFLQRSLEPGWRLLPILVGHLGPGDAARLAAAIRPLADEDTLVVASGDFTHFGPNYGYQPFPSDGKVAARLRELDDGAFQRIADLDGDGLEAYQQRTAITVCGIGPFDILSRLLARDVRPRLLRYDTSGAMTADFTNSVSYFAVAFSGPHAPADADEVLSPAQMRTLLALARRSVETSVAGGADARPEALVDGLAVDERLQRMGGAFVTLEEHGVLRGCIGMVIPREPLWRTVATVASSAALHDGRFAPVRPEELPELDVKVSALGPLRPIASWRSFRVGAHGIVMEAQERSAVFLPEVAVEQGWTVVETLAHLSRKAGLPTDAWQHDADFHVFTSQVEGGPLRPMAASPTGSRTNRSRAAASSGVSR